MHVSPDAASHTLSPHDGVHWLTQPSAGAQCSWELPQKPNRLQQLPIGHSPMDGPHSCPRAAAATANSTTNERSSMYSLGWEREKKGN